MEVVAPQWKLRERERKQLRTRVDVYYRGKSADRVWKKAHSWPHRYKNGSGTNMKTGESDIGFDGPCPTMKKLAVQFKKMKGVRVVMYQGEHKVTRVKCGRKGSK